MRPNLHEIWRQARLAVVAPEVHMWKVTHVAEDRTMRTQFVIAATNAEADAQMVRLYGLPLASAALRVTGAVREVRRGARS